jgi:glyoxylase-like metal-dependent hydrolase (beta-lactamase superfamily II)
MLPLEDSYQDILGKAQRGLRITSEQLASQAGVSVADYEQLREGKFDEGLIRKVAPFLNLAAERLIASGKNAWYPQIASLPVGIKQITTSWKEMTVNAYLVWDPASQQAAVFDTGAEATPLLTALAENKLRAVSIFITHTHPDHVMALEALTQATGASVYVHQRGALPGASTFNWGDTFALGDLQIETRQTTGHAYDGTTYVVKGLATPVAIVGDALFAGSMGGGSVSYVDALWTNRQNIFTLPDETILCPGHGPLTTVELEKRHNPFYPAL